MIADDARFASTDRLHTWCERIGAAGYRGTATDAHHRLIDWIEIEMRDLGLSVRRDEFTVARWQPLSDDGGLEGAASLRLDGAPVPIAGAVPYSRPGAIDGPLTRVPPGEAITADNAAGRVVVRTFPSLPLPYDYLLGQALVCSPDAEALAGKIWDRPGLADSLLHQDLLDAGEAGALGVIIEFDLPREHVAGYHEPHKGTHYAVPAVFVGNDTASVLRDGAATSAQIDVRARVETVTTANLHATLPGSSPERAVLVTHTDGNTWVQENGIAALVGIAEWLAQLPTASRNRTVEFVFSTAHLHISREGAARYAAELDAAYDGGEIAYVFPVEHLGVRALEPVRDCGDDGGDGGGRRLAFDGHELLLWSVGPSEVLRDAVKDAVAARAAGPVAVLPGLGTPTPGQVPEIVSFGGLGTLFHMHLLPTTSVLTGPWSLWAPHFGPEAIDVALLRRQCLAVLDVVIALDGHSRDAIAGGYLADRAARAAGAPVGRDGVPPEFADGVTIPQSDDAIEVA